MNISVTDLIGTPFAYGGRPNSGDNKLDCYGLVQEVCGRFGQTLPDRQYSEQSNIIAVMMSTQMSEWQRCERKPGAVLLFKIRGVAIHVGVILDNIRFIHTWQKSGGVCVERISDWERRIEGAYQYVG